MVPHFSSELLESLLGKNLKDTFWSTFDPKLAQISEVEIAIQVNGKLRGTLNTFKDATEKEIRIKSEKIVEKWLYNKTFVKFIYVPNRLVNFVIK